MKIKSLLLILPVLLAASVQTSAQTVVAEAAAVRVPLENYIKAHASGDGGNLARSFHPEARIQGIRIDNGKLVTYEFAAYVKTFTGQPAADEARRQRRIESIDITKNAAVAKLVFDYPAMKITDYLLLLKIEGEWKIMNKIAQGEPRSTVEKN